MDIVLIAHFITEFKSGGTSRFIYIADHLKKQDNVELVTSSFDHITKKQRVGNYSNLNFAVTLLKEASYKKNISLKRFLSHKGFGKQVKKYLECRKKPDLIYCAVPSLDCAYYAAEYAKKNKVKFIIDIQDLWPEAFQMIVKYKKINKVLFGGMKRKADYIYSCADVIISVSETYCRRAKEVNHRANEIIPVFLGTELDYFDKSVIRNRVLRVDNNFVIGYCGTLGHSYDIKCVLDAMIILRKKRNDNIVFWIMGDGPLKDTFERYARVNNLNVVFWGRIPYEKMCAVLSACDVCINPIVGSSVASIINKHADYAAAGIPVINTQNSIEYKKLVEDYECGINCASSNVQEVASAIDEFLNNIYRREKMGENARIMAMEKFDRNRTYVKIIDVIYQLYKRK